MTTLRPSQLHANIIIKAVVFAVFLCTFFAAVIDAGADLIDNGDGTITDTDIGLMWYDGEFGPGDLPSASSWKDNLNSVVKPGGYSDWTLPTVSQYDHLYSDEGATYMFSGGTYWTFEYAFNMNGTDYYWTFQLGMEPMETPYNYTGGAALAVRDIDRDNDGYYDDAYAGGDDCNDLNSEVHPGAAEILCDGTDQDCDGMDDDDPPDADGDAVSVCAGDCNDSDASVYPGADDSNCNGVDEDCAGGADDGYVVTPTECGTGACFSTGQIECQAGAEINTCSPLTPGTEGPAGDPTCSDGVDNDCDGAVDDMYDGGCYTPVQETWQFERLWPSTLQPWVTGTSLRGGAVDVSGNVYIVTSEYIYKFSSNGNLITKWEGQGTFIAVDSHGDVYVTTGYYIVKYSSDGSFIKQWGEQGSGDGQFYTAKGIAIDSNDFVYVVDIVNDRIQKFSSDGQFIKKWGGSGNGDGQFNNPWAVAVDDNDNIYVTDRGNDRVQKFTSDGNFITKFGSTGSGDGEFQDPLGIGVDAGGTVYVQDGYERVEKFTPEGVFISEWGEWGYEPQNIFEPDDIIVDKRGYVYVVEFYDLKRFTLDGEYINQWGRRNNDAGRFDDPTGIAYSPDGDVYVIDESVQRVQKFTSSGQFQTKWGTPCILPAGHGCTDPDNEGPLETGDGQFGEPGGIAVSDNGNVYVSDYRNHRIQVFGPDGEYTAKWGSQGTGDGQFNRPKGITITDSGRIYVADYSNNRVQVFTLDGQFIGKWGSRCILDGGYGCVDPDDTGPLESGDGQFYKPEGITVDGSGFVYVVDSGNYRVQKFTPDGEFVMKWGSECSFVTGNNCVDPDGAGPLKPGDGQFGGPEGIAVDSRGLVYVADPLNNRIQKFTPDGQFLDLAAGYDYQTYSDVIDGIEEPDPLGVSGPSFLVFDNDDLLYVTETDNRRVLVLNNTEISVSSNNKAIIVAGGGPFDGNNLWDATRMSANFAFNVLVSQGFSKNSIYYLTSDTDLDLDDNGLPDEVDGDATNDNLRDAVCGSACGGTGTGWAMDADNLVVYIVDHGGDMNFRMSSTDILSAADLDAWLDTLQSAIPGKVIVVYEACESGSFVSALTPQGDKERIVITSTAPGESAHFVTHGTISFSNYFWTQIFTGENIKDAFDVAAGAVSQSIANQTPLLDDNGNGTANEEDGDGVPGPVDDGFVAQNTYIGNGMPVEGVAPVIGSVSPDRIINDTSSASITAYNVSGSNGIARVWAVIRTPEYNLGLTDNPVQDLPSIDLFPVGNHIIEVEPR